MKKTHHQISEEIKQTLVSRAKEGDMAAMKTLIKYQNEPEDTNIDTGKFTYEERLELKKFIEDAIKKIQAKLTKKTKPS